jgi:REP element-mobilizing transposase RayT
MAFYQRHLPHWHLEEAWLFITWRLAGSLPVIPARLTSDPEVTPGKAFLLFDTALDQANYGPVWLKDTRVASAVLEVLNDAETQGLCRIGGYVIMSNHVHLLTLPFVTPDKLTHRVKGVSAFRANRILKTTGSFWQHESFDRWVRDSREYQRILFYIENNPVRAGLVSSPEAWPWSSAGRRTS